MQEMKVGGSWSEAAQANNMRPYLKYKWKVKRAGGIAQVVEHLPSKCEEGKKERRKGGREGRKEGRREEGRDGSAEGGTEKVREGGRREGRKT
jgi:hypothetical protein